MLSTQEARRPSIWAIPRAAVRFVLRWLIKQAVLGFVCIWRFKPVVALIVVAAGVWFWFGNGGQVPLLSPSNAAQSAAFQRVSVGIETVPPAQAAEQYLWGQSNYDANAMWGALSDDMKRASARSGGVTLQRLTQELDERRRSGLTYNSVRYVGGHLAPDGRSFYLYVVGVNSGTNTRYVPYTFTVSNEGKIVNID